MNIEDRRNWNNLPDVYVRLKKDELGYPPKEWEQLKAEQIGSSEIYRIKSIPFYAKGLAYGDEIATETSKEGYYPVAKSVLKRSGFSTMRLSIKGEDREQVISYFTSEKCLLEFNGLLVAIAIPRERFDEVSDFICDEKDAGRWDAEDGFLIIDENGQSRLA